MSLEEECGYGEEVIVAEEEIVEVVGGEGEREENEEEELDEGGVEWLVVDEVGEEDGEELDDGVGGAEEDKKEEGDEGEKQESGGDVRIVRVVESKKRRKRIMNCPVCDQPVTHMYRHAAYHLPWFWYSATCCRLCSTQHVNGKALQHHLEEDHNQQEQPDWDPAVLADLVIGVLNYICRQLGFKRLDELLLHVSNNHEINQLCRFKQLTDSDLALCRLLDLK